MEDKAQNVTLLDVANNSVCGLRTEEKDGYSAVQVELVVGNNKKNGKIIREFIVESLDNYSIGDELKTDLFEIGDKVIIKGISKGKGYQGVVKRHGFAGSPASHGHRHDLRAPGSIGSAFPERVMKGKRMAGRMGSDSVTVKNLEIVVVDKDNNIIGVRGAVPGNNGGVVKIINQD